MCREPRIAADRAGTDQGGKAHGAGAKTPTVSPLTFMTSRADALSHRKAAYKTPTRMMEPQEARRQAALAAQQRHRLQRQDATRTDIALFQSLSLADHDSGDEGADIDRTEGVAKYVSTMQPSGGASGKPRRKRTSRWANFCMYAELLEMSTDDAMGASDTHGTDGVPLDLHENWIVLAPLPAGKRCLAVSTQANGVGGVGTCGCCVGYDRALLTCLSIDNFHQVAPERPHTAQIPISYASKHDSRLHS